MIDTIQTAPLMGGHKLYSFAAAAKASNIPGHRGGQHLNASTLYRWHIKGVKAKNGELVHLEAVQVGCRLLTTLEAIAEFSRRLTAASITTSEVLPTRSPAEPSRVARELDSLGIK